MLADRFAARSQTCSEDECGGTALPERTTGEPADLGPLLQDPSGAALLRHFLGKMASREISSLCFRLVDGGTRIEDGTGRALFRSAENWHSLLLHGLRALADLPDDQGRSILQRARFALPAESAQERVWIRASFVKGVAGEEAQLKVMPRESTFRSLPELGLTARQCFEIRRALDKPGLFWVTAASEEGLGSSLFALLREVPGRGRSLTLEEEVHYRSPELLQLETLGLGCGARDRILRELKYLDFDRLLVDRVSPAQLKELLALAVRKRWVLAGCAEADMEATLRSLAALAGDVPLYGLRSILHQKLVPILCPSCRTQSDLSTGDRKLLRGLVPSGSALWEEGNGCSACAGRGTRGTRAFFELLPVDAPTREALYAQARGETRLPGLLEGVSPSIRRQVAEAVAAGEVSLAELWEFL